uniref:Uncharacterized protein n=2 Tax=Avena sativa TaxID=4498 RepID=A0ACD5XMU3_AVESA
MAAPLSSALSSMEVMLDALMQRGIGKPDDKTKEETPPALPTRPTVRGRLPSTQRPGSPAPPWANRPPLPPIPPPPQDEEQAREIVAINAEFERRALVAEEEVKQKDDDVRHKDEEIVGLRQQVEHYESRLTECEAKMRAVEEELQRQIAALQQQQQQMSQQSTTNRTSFHPRELSFAGSRPACLPRERSIVGSRTSCATSCLPRERSIAGITRAPQPQSTTAAAAAAEAAAVEVGATKQQNPEENLAEEFAREKQAFEHAAKAVGEVNPGTMSVDELKMLKRQFMAWRKEYATRLRKAKAELRKRVHSEKSNDTAPAAPAHGSPGHAGSPRGRRWCGWWRAIKVPKFRAPKRCCACTCAIKFPSPSSCCSCFSCCFRRNR